jgi:pimeloyl-ACP methyl ester carboxylesterase
MYKVAATALLLLFSMSVASAPVATGGFFTTSDKVKLHYLEAGRGRPIVFIPGGMFSAEYYEPQIREFSRDHRAIALSHRARGRSEHGLQGEGYEFSRLAADIHELIEHLDLKDVVLVGSSMGVQMVLTYAERFGTDRLGAVTLIDGIVWELDAPRIERCINWVNGIKAMQSDFRAWSERAVHGMFLQPHPEGYLSRLVDIYLGMPTNIAAWYGVVSFCSPGGGDKRAGLAKLRAASTPVMYVVATPMLRPQGDKVKDQIPGARMEVLEGVGHAISADVPDRFNRLLRDFLKAPSRGGQS